MISVHEKQLSFIFVSLVGGGLWDMNIFGECLRGGFRIHDFRSDLRVRD